MPGSVRINFGEESKRKSQSVWCFWLLSCAKRASGRPRNQDQELGAISRTSGLSETVLVSRLLGKHRYVQSKTVMIVCRSFMFPLIGNMKDTAPIFGLRFCEPVEQGTMHEKYAKQTRGNWSSRLLHSSSSFCIQDPGNTNTFKNFHNQRLWLDSRRHRTIFPPRTIRVPEPT